MAMESESRAVRQVTMPATHGHDHTEDTPAEIDEPPESLFAKHTFTMPSAYARTMLSNVRRESLLTRQLHSETDHSDDEPVPTQSRAHSAASTWSNPSMTSAAELTSDDGRSAPSPTISPPLPPTQLRTALPVTTKPLTASEPQIVGLDTIAAAKDPVEVGLGRKRCITFACGNKEKPKPATTTPSTTTSPPTTQSTTTTTVDTTPKRKCALRFICPTKPAQSERAADTKATPRAVSPAVKHHRSSSFLKAERRASQSASPTSPRLSRRTPSSSAKTTTIAKRQLVKPLNDSDDSGAEATKFHEFASSEDEPDEWTQESTCYRNRLCVADTLKKENVIRQLAEEVAEEEAVEEDEEDEEDEEEADEVDGMDDEDEDAVDDDQDTINDLDNAHSESDAGFHSDDEEGFAVSDSEDDDGSDNEWWTPGGASTAATSAEHLDHTSKITARADMKYGSSLASNSSANLSPHSRQRRPRAFRTHSKSSAVRIDRAPTPDLPDSTDFVCGTLDEDRPQEQAYINCMKQREAAKHPLIPQDIDPTFPTSDPEMDEEDDDDEELDVAASSSAEEIMHGSLDSIHGTARPLSPAPRRGSMKKRSPVRHRSPAPAALRVKSPAPKARLARSPPPPALRTKSPAPKARATRSPAPVTARAHSPAPRKLFNRSPQRTHTSPARGPRTTSPPNTRRASPTNLQPTTDCGLAGRPNMLTIAASLPKRPGGFLLSRLGMHASDADSSDTVGPGHRGGRRRGAIDIVKGLEKKKQRRHEKLCQKAAAKAAARGEERKKVKPGRGCERMREVGLELQKYKGGAGHILSY